MINTLREYQKKAVELVVPLIGTQEKILISMPQGTGKSITIVAILLEYFRSQGKIYNHKVLFLVDRVSILEQIKNTFIDSFKDPNVVTDNLFSFEIEEHSIFISTIQSFAKEDLFEKLDKDQFAIIVFYDCERMGVGRSAAPAQKVIKYFKSLSNIGIDDIIQVSSRYFGEPVYRYTFSDAIEQSVFAPYKVSYIYFSQKELTWSIVENLKQTGGIDLNLSFYSPEALRALSQSVIDYAANDKVVVFCESIKSATLLSNQINQLVGNDRFSKVVVSSLSASENTKAIHDFKNDQEPQILISVEMLVTGVDLPFVDKIFLLRNFPERTYFIQLISQYLRSYPNKEYLQIYDYAGNKWYDDLIGALPVVSEDKTELVAEQNDTDETFHSTESIRFSKTNIQFRDKREVRGVLGVQDIAGELADIIYQMPCEQGRMIGIFGEWGRGKTFLVNQTWESLKGKPGMERVDFHAWKYQETPAVWAYLYEKFADTYYASASNSWIRFWRRINLNRLRLGLKEVVFLLLSVGFSFYLSFGFSFFEKIDGICKVINAIGLSVVFSLIFLFFRYKNTARELFKKFYTKTSFSNLLGIQAEVQKELKLLIKAWNYYVNDLKILLFVDDIDRCSEEKIIQIIDSLRVMLDDEELSDKLVIVTAIDERILKRAIKLKYFPLVKDEISEEGIPKLISEYLDKLFISAIKLGDLTSEEKDEFFIEFTKTEREEEGLPPFHQLFKRIEGPGSDTNIETEATELTNDIYSPGDESEILEETVDGVGNSTSDTPSENTETSPVSNNELPSTSFLTVEEVNILRKRLSQIGKINPRQIRILYYRYLLAKNLLIRQYEKIGKNNIWISSQYSDAFIGLLITLHQNECSVILSEQKKEILDPKITEFKVGDLKVNKLDYKILISVLDTVIGY